MKTEQNISEKIMTEARQLAAQCWCDKETSSIVMDARLAEAFAVRFANKIVENNRMKEFINRFLHPEDLGYTYGKAMRDDAREALGRNRTET